MKTRSHCHHWVERRTGQILDWRCECGEVRLGIVGGLRPSGVIEEAEQERRLTEDAMEDVTATHQEKLKALREEVAVLRKQVEALTLVLKVGPQFFDIADADAEVDRLIAEHRYAP